MIETLTLLLPILWAAVAAIIGIVLYKSSSALFQQSTQTKTETRRIRLAGSVTIAALAFWGMKISTPSERLLGSQQGMVTVPSAELQRLWESSVRLDRLTLELEACIVTLQGADCRGKAEEVKAESAQLNELIGNSLRGTRLH